MLYLIQNTKAIPMDCFCVSNEFSYKTTCIYRREKGDEF